MNLEKTKNYLEAFSDLVVTDQSIKMIRYFDSELAGELYFFTAIASLSLQ